VDDQNQDLVTEIQLTGLAQTPERNRLRLVLRFGPALLVLLAIVILLRSGLLGRLSIDSLKASRGTLLAFVHAHPAGSLLLYLAVYVTTVALSLPIALILTLTGGFLFGAWLGGSAAAVGCTLGAVIVFLITRLTAGDAVETRTGPRVRALAEDIKKDAFFYLLTLRLIPVMPFWLTNVAAGLIAIRTTTFAGATLIGIFPPAVIYAGVGSGLGSLFDSGQPLSLHVLITARVLLPLAGLAVLSVLPIFYQRWRGRRGPAAQRGQDA
jgi:uncharacterized membrane protein YdjX (TVP38/TMEM64 family)